MDSRLIYLMRLFLGIVFIYASIDKIIDPATFSDIIDNYRFSPVYFSNLAALIIPWIELIVGLSLITGIYIEGSVILSMGLMLFFIIILTRAVALGIDTECGCGLPTAGSGAQDVQGALLRRIFEDIVFFVMLVLIQLKLNFKRDNK